MSTGAFPKSKALELKRKELEGGGFAERQRSLCEQARPEPCRDDQAQFRAPGLNQPWASCISGHSCAVWLTIWGPGGLSGAQGSQGTIPPHQAPVNPGECPYSRAAQQPTGRAGTDGEPAVYSLFLGDLIRFALYSYPGCALQNHRSFNHMNVI